jgi:magnesium transporter
MKYWIQDGVFTAYTGEGAAFEQGKQYLWIIGTKELSTVSADLCLGETFIKEIQSGDVSKFESHDGFDFITLNIPADLFAEGESQRVCLYLSESVLVFFCDHDVVLEKLLSEYAEEPQKKMGLARILHQYFDRVTYDDSLALKKIEQEITALEETLIVSKKSDFNFLANYRKKLLELKTYYEQLLEIFEAIEQDENGLIGKTELRFFRILAGRANRLYNGVVNLRDYVTQVREAYQTQIDINLNSVMKVFTVITSVFFPLTLIVGWYGMNLKMPEFGWQYGYAFVIGISIATAIATLLYFKKKKWF